MKKFVGPCMTPAILEKVYNWKTDSDFRYECRHIERIAGCDAMFIAIDDDCGIKFFMKESTAKMCFWMVRILKHFNYTPRAWDLRMVAYKGELIWCFMMERCTVMTELKKTHGSWKANRIFDRSCEILTYRLRDTLLSDHDWAEENLGITHDGHIVCIDVGHMSYKFHELDSCASMMKHIW